MELASETTNTSEQKNVKETSGAARPVNLFVFLGVIACFILSGFAALLYQTAWMRQFSLVFGTSELAIAAVLSAYMGGLALGSNLAARYIHKVTRPVLFYGILEAGIAIAALCVPLFLKLANMAYIGTFGGQPLPVDASGLGQSFFYLIVAFLVLVIPTALMGATLPLLIKYVVRSKEQIGSRVGLLYAMNTFGAIGGTLVAGFILLPALGLNGTIWVGIAINLLVFAIAAFIARAIGDHSKLHAATDNAADEASLDTSDEAQKPATPSLLTSKQFWILPIMLLSGANSFVYEVLWTRLLGHILGGSITAFSTMLAGFLSGIAIGSAIASRFAKTRAQAIGIFVFVQIGIALTSILIYQYLPAAIPNSGGLKGNAPLAFLVLLPATIFIGATFPLAVRILAFDESDAASSSARVYSWNTVGAIIGATVAAFFLIPILKYEGAVKAAVLINLLIAFIAAFYWPRAVEQAGEKSGLNKGLLGSVAAILIVVGVFYKPAMPEETLRASPVWAMDFGEITFYEVGRSATVVTIEDDSNIYIRTNGLPEASIYRKGSPPVQHNQYMLSTMPVIARPDVEDMLVVGFGGGNALEGVPSSVNTVDVIEIEREVIAANRAYGDARRRDPLKDPRVKVILNDARSALMLTDKKYDAIVSQPSHPWTAGASHLYTREFMGLANEHLTDDGVYLQWMNTQFIDEFLFKSLCATMLDVFEHVRVYHWQKEVIFFLGSNEPLDVEADIARTGRPFTDAPFEYAEKGLGSAEDVLAALAMDQENVELFARAGEIITDNNNYMATLSARAMDKGTVLRGNAVYHLLKDFDPLIQADNALRTVFPQDINYLYLAKRFEVMKMISRGVALADSLVEAGDANSLAMIGVGQERQNQRQDSQKNLLLALRADPDNQQVRYALLSPWLASVIAKEPVPESIAEQINLLKGSAAATVLAGQASYTGDMKALMGLDKALSSVKPSDLWYGTAIKLRAQWRMRVSTPGAQPRFFNEAKKLVDGVLAFNKDAELSLIRVTASYEGGDYSSAYETATLLLYTVNSQVEFMQGGGNLPSSTINNLKLQAKTADSLYDKLLGKDGFSAEEMTNFRSSIDGALSGLSRF